MSQKANSRILVINPGSTSTKVALYEQDRQLALENIHHDKEDLSRFPRLWDQFEFRLSAINEFLARLKIDRLDAVVGRGGLLKPLQRGTYLVDQNMIGDARQGVQGEHVSNLGVALALEIATKYACPAYTVDPVSVDEVDDVARISGHPMIVRRSLAHTLNVRAAAHWAAQRAGIDPDKANFVVAHLGGGITVAAVKGDRMIDVSDASSAGPFSPERSGGLPLQPFIDLCFSGQYSKSQLQKMVMGEGGLIAYLGTSDVVQVESKIAQGDAQALLIFNAMAYQIAKEIGAMATVLCGLVDGVVLTGGLAHSQRLVDEIGRRVQFIAPVYSFPGELEMDAMVQGALRVMQGTEKIQTY